MLILVYIPAYTCVYMFGNCFHRLLAIDKLTQVSLIVKVKKKVNTISKIGPQKVSNRHITLLDICKI